MQEIFLIIIGIILPFVGTTLGAATVFFLKKDLTPKGKRLLLGFAAGLMFAASIWSLIIPAIEMSQNFGKLSWLPAAIGLILGCVFFIGVDIILANLEEKIFKKTHNTTKENAMLIFAITLHNFPEGMAVGVAFAGLLSGNSMLGLSAALALSIGIAIQNFPEGAAVSLPIASEGKSKLKAFLIGMLSGLVEPISAIITILISGFITPILPYLLAFSAGAMIYVVVEELVPQIQDKSSKIGTIGIFIGFSIMMILDVMQKKKKNSVLKLEADCLFFFKNYLKKIFYSV